MQLRLFTALLRSDTLTLSQNSLLCGCLPRMPARLASCLVTEHTCRSTQHSARVARLAGRRLLLSLSAWHVACFGCLSCTCRGWCLSTLALSGNGLVNWLHIRSRFGVGLDSLLPPSRHSTCLSHCSCSLLGACLQCPPYSPQSSQVM